MSELLEGRYRRVLGMLPRGYRAEHAEEMLAVLMDGAQPGRARPKAREVLSVAALAARLRFAVGGARVSGSVVGDVARRAVLAYLVFDFGLMVQANARGSRLGDSFGPMLLEAGLIVALVSGRRRSGWILSVGFAAYQFYEGQWWRYGLLFWCTNLGAVTRLLVPVAALAAFHSGAPRVAGAQRWFLAWCGISTAFWISGWTADRGLEFDIMRVPAVSAALYTVAMVAAFRQVRASPVWPAALALAGFPVIARIMTTPMTTVFGFGAAPRNAVCLWVAVGAELLIVVAALAAFLFALKRRLTAAGGEEAV